MCAYRPGTGIRACNAHHQNMRWVPSLSHVAAIEVGREQEGAHLGRQHTRITRYWTHPPTRDAAAGMPWRYAPIRAAQQIIHVAARGLHESLLNTHLVCFSCHGVLNIFVARILYMIAFCLCALIHMRAFRQRPNEVVLPCLFPPRVRTRTETPSDSTGPASASARALAWQGTLCALGNWAGIGPV